MSWVVVATDRATGANACVIAETPRDDWGTVATVLGLPAFTEEQLLALFKPYPDARDGLRSEVGKPAGHFEAYLKGFTPQERMFSLHRTDTIAMMVKSCGARIEDPDNIIARHLFEHGGLPVRSWT